MFQALDNNRVKLRTIKQTLPLFVCVLFFLLENAVSTMMFLTVKEDQEIHGVEPFQEMTVDSQLICYAACQRSPAKCLLVEISQEIGGSAGKDGKFICKLFEINTGRIEDHMRPATRPGTVVSAPRSKRDCADWLKHGHKTDDVYYIHFNGSPKKVFCDMTTDGGGWIVMQKRFDGSVDFNRDWKTYQSGFGDANGELWLGNEFIHQYTSTQQTEMYVEGKAFDGQIAVSRLSNAIVGSSVAKYPITFDSCLSTEVAWCTDFEIHNNTKYSTNDADNDNNAGMACAVIYPSGWWFRICFSVNLNGLYSHTESITGYMGIMWLSFRPPHQSLKETKMMLRRTR